VTDMPDFTAFRILAGTERTEFKRTVLKPAIRELGHNGWMLSELSAFFSAALPCLEADERAEVTAAVLAKGEYHPFRDGLHFSDVVKDGFILDAKSVQYEFIYRSRPDAAYRQATAYRTTGFLPGLFIVYQGTKKDHRIVFVPGLLRRNASFTLNRVVNDVSDWRWNKKKPMGILITQDGDNLTAFLAQEVHAENALKQMEAAMSTATKKFKNDSRMREDLNEISADILQAGFDTDFGKEFVAEKEAKAKASGRKEGRRKGRDEAQAEIFHKLLGVMSEEEARRITGYRGS
jgi:hypothetical protein